MDCFCMWEPQHSSRKQNLGIWRKEGFQLDFKGLFHQKERNLSMVDGKQGGKSFRTILN